MSDENEETVAVTAPADSADSTPDGFPENVADTADTDSDGEDEEDEDEDTDDGDD